MPLSPAQLETWSHQGAKTTSAQAYASVRAALLRDDSPISRLPVEIYLQGSYGNDTNIYAESDVDIVVQLNSVWRRDISALPANQQNLYLASVVSSSYTGKQYRTDVLDALRSYYGAAKILEEGPNAIKVRTPNDRTADIVPGFSYRQYSFFYSNDVQSFVPGISFAEAYGNYVINFPRMHIENGIAKNSVSRTGGRYKETVRMFKSARSYLVNCGLVDSKTAPSYFVECLLYNVPDELFVADRQMRFAAIWDYLWARLPTSTARCQNDQVLLFGTTARQWTIKSAALFMEAVRNLWDPK